MTKETSPNPDVDFEIGYDLKNQKASFRVGVSNVFSKIGKKKFGFTFTDWFTRVRGRQDAKIGLPATTDEKPDGRESQIWTERSSQVSKITKHANEAVQEAEQWINDNRPTQQINTDRVKKEIAARLEEVRGHYRGRFETIRGEFGESLESYQDFRSKHALDRPAEVPLFFLRPIVVLLGALLCETIINAFIFAGISTQGMIGGWLIAVVISVVNIVFGLTLGLLIIRYGLAWRDRRRTALIVAGGLLIAIIVFFNLYNAHFREVAEEAVLADRFGDVALTRERSPGFGDAWPHFIANPFNLGSILGIGLFVVGLTIAGFATYEGYKGFTDPFPGYGKRGKRFYLNNFLRQAIDDEARALSYDVLDRAKQRAERSTGIHAHYKQEVFKAVGFAGLLMNASAAAERRVNNNAWSLVDSFRSANKRKRTKLHLRFKRKPVAGRIDPGPPPEYFNDDPRTSGDWESVIPTLKSCKDLAQSTYDLIDYNIKRLEEIKEFIAEVRSRVDKDIAQRLDPADAHLVRQAEDILARRGSGLRVVTATAGKK